MPKQHVLFGRPVPRVSSRRISVLLAALSIFAVFSLLFTVTTSLPPGSRMTMADHKWSIPKWKTFGSSIFNPFKQPSHPPPRQRNDTYGEASWYSNWKWLSIPFSSTITLDENRSLLPELVERPPIYCYYDITVERDEDSKNAESDILLTWRRAWWAKGFKPIILSSAEAMNNPMYEEIQRMQIDPKLSTDMMRWLAWENMGGGLLSHYLLFPMGPYDDALLGYLRRRRGDYPKLTRWNGLGDGLFAGSKADIAAAIKLALGNEKQLKTAQDFLSALPSETDSDPFAWDDLPDSLAFYDAKTLEKKYPKVADAITANRAEGLKGLNKLINTHLHVSWQNTFSSGIAVLKPKPQHTTIMIQNAVELANQLTQCSDSPLPGSCPPNRPKCVACVAAHPMRITSPARYRNKTSIYTIGTVPHPYTFNTLVHLKSDMDIAWVRRHTERDPWLFEVTKELLGTGVAGGPRVLKFKEAVAGEGAPARAIWLAAEKDLPDDLDWYFGFEIPRTPLDDGKSETPVPGPERRPQPKADPADGPVSSKEDLAKEPDLLKRARDVGKSKEPNDAAVREATEAWNLADTEAWRFARAYLARARVERLKWEEEEAKYAGGAGSEKGRTQAGWGRWLDRKEDD
ncbi:Plasma membrane fusion protein prm1 [Pleurostoma richardsiae]|uniref:Plasma membrane fusion protein prm1 n=1 Tax=Pleurostoma richardsiae TaxID=41990 RepID=A0AA38R815_9PEZI|nr:Plasma membrane fusion protein prm1 [Pleurostoma richardsiae]